MNDFCPIESFDHLEFYVGNAMQAASFYERHFGFSIVARRGLETGSREIASYVLEQGDIRFVLSSALDPAHPVAKAAHLHGDGVGIIALRVPDAEVAHRETTSRGARSAISPSRSEDDRGTLAVSGIHAYGDVVLKFVERHGYSGTFAPGFEDLPAAGDDFRRGGEPGVGLTGIDHVVGNVELGKMDEWVRFFSETMGFSQLAHFDDEAISTEYSALMSKVMQNGGGRIKFPINEPAEGRKKSQIAEYLDYNHGPGVQHVACTTDDIVTTVGRLRDRGVGFLRVPDTYYRELVDRVGEIDEPLDRLQELGILVDRDEDGYLLQIFTQPVEDRPTVFYEVIERHGSRGFGEGNFKALFVSLEQEQAKRGNL